MADLERRKFIVASHSARECEFLAAYLNQHISNSTVVTAGDGIEAQAKIVNDPPLVVMISHELPKKNAVALTQWLLSKKIYSHVCVIILSEIPDTEHFVDEVVLGRVQFLNAHDDEAKLGKVVTRALNYSVNDVNREFKLRFLAPGDFLIREGEKADKVFIVRHGSLSASVKRESEILNLGKIEVGEFVGEMAYINGEPRSADVIANTDCELIEIPIDDLDHMLFQKPAWSRALMRTLSNRVRQGNKSKQSAA